MPMVACSSCGQDASTVNQDGGVYTGPTTDYPGRRWSVPDATYGTVIESNVQITHGSILGSLRRTQADMSWTNANGLPMRPYLTLDQDEPLTAGQATELDVPLWPSLWSIEPGHTLVVRIATQPAGADRGGFPLLATCFVLGVLGTSLYSRLEGHGRIEQSPSLATTSERRPIADRAMCE